MSGLALSDYCDPVVFDTEMHALADSTWQLFAILDELEGALVRRPMLGVSVVAELLDGKLTACVDDAPLAPTPSRGTAVRIESIGRFVFVALSPKVVRLAEFLADYAGVLRAISNHIGSVVVVDQVLNEANWKHCVEITLDDYHVPTVHPTTFGSEPMEAHQVVYRRDGRHSCFLKRRDATWQFDGFWEAVRRDQFDPTGYKIFQLFATTAISNMRLMSIAVSIIPVDVGRTLCRSIAFEWRTDPLSGERAEQAAALLRAINTEDRAVCEELQRGMTSIDQRARRVPLLGRFEQRIAWFHEDYLQLMRDHRASITTPGSVSRR